MAATSSIPAERQILFACARVRVGPLAADAVRALCAQRVDWDSVASLAARHGLVPLLYRNLNAACLDQVPSVVLARLRAGSVAIAARNLRLQAELLAVLDALSRSGIPAVPFKGPVFAAAIYGSLALRASEDLDLIVRPRDFDAAKACLFDRGYRLLYLLGGARETIHFAYKRACHLRRADGAVHVDLGCAFAERQYAVRYDVAAAWERLESVTVGGSVVNVLSAEDTILALCIHGTRHGWRRLSWLCDLAELTRARPVNWPAVMRLARRRGLLRMVCLGLLSAQELLGVEVPDNVLGQARNERATRRLADAVLAPLTSGERDRAGGAGGLRFWIRSRERLRDRLACLFLWLVTPTRRDFAALRLPGRNAAPYYLVRAVRAPAARLAAAARAMRSRVAARLPRIAGRGTGHVPGRGSSHSGRRPV